MTSIRQSSALAGLLEEYVRAHLESEESKRQYDDAAKHKIAAYAHLVTTEEQMRKLVHKEAGFDTTHGPRTLHIFVLVDDEQWAVEVKLGGSEVHSAALVAR